MDRITGELEGCVSIADDIVFGTTEDEHNTNLLRLMELAKKEGLTFNSKKCTIKTSKISFYGSDCTSEGMKPDPQKIADVENMPTPQNVDELERLFRTSHLSVNIRAPLRGKSKSTTRAHKR